MVDIIGARFGFAVALPVRIDASAKRRKTRGKRLRAVFTLDRTDFSVYRPARLKRFIIVPEA
jgi:hypothetical protein